MKTKLTLTRHRDYGRDHWTIADTNYNMVGFSRLQAETLRDLLDIFLSDSKRQEGTQVATI